MDEGAGEERGDHRGEMNGQDERLFSPTGTFHCLWMKHDMRQVWAEEIRPAFWNSDDCRH